jgi:hypothetical protein
MTEQAKRKPGRPANPETETKFDLHLWIKPSLLKRIDAARGSEARTAYIIRIVSEQLDK